QIAIFRNCVSALRERSMIPLKKGAFMKVSSRSVVLTVALLICSTAISGSALATLPGPGAAGGPKVPQATDVGAGTLDTPVIIRQDGVILAVGRGDATVRSFDLTYPV